MTPSCAGILKRLLAHPLTRGMDLDDPQTTALRRRIIREKPFLRRLYDEWYRWIAASLPAGSDPVLELGSGAGFLDEYVPNLITSEVFPVAGIRLVLDGQRLPFPNSSLRAIVMTDVLHHIPRPKDFFTEAGRCVRAGGRIVLIEPWVTQWSRRVFRHLHHEPFDPKSAAWEIPTSGPLSGANGAMPWILFERDRTIFEQKFPQWRIDLVEPFMPLSYLVSGGVSMRTLMPGFSYPLWRAAERLARPWRRQTGMFAKIVLTNQCV